MRIVVTGASGRIGSVLFAALRTGHDTVLMDRAPSPGAGVLLADLSVPPRPGAGAADWSAAFAGADAVVHLAGASSVHAPWAVHLREGVRTLRNVLAAAEAHRVPRFVYASSNWAVRLRERLTAPACYHPEGPKIGSRAFPMPWRFYGFTKAYGEWQGWRRVRAGRLASFVAVRIGAFAAVPRPILRPHAVWLGAEDCAALFRRCIEAPVEGFHLVYGVSAQREAPYDLSHTRALLGWTPRQVA